MSASERGMHPNFNDIAGQVAESVRTRHRLVSEQWQPICASAEEVLSGFAKLHKIDLLVLQADAPSGRMDWQSQGVSCSISVVGVPGEKPAVMVMGTAWQRDEEAGKIRSLPVLQEIIDAPVELPALWAALEKTKRSLPSSEEEFQRAGETSKFIIHNMEK